MDTTSSQQLYKKAKRLRITAIVLLVLQGLGYLGTLTQKDDRPKDTPEAIGYFIGENLFTIIAIILLIRSTFLKREAKLAAQKEEIERIGL